MKYLTVIPGNPGSGSLRVIVYLQPPNVKISKTSPVWIGAWWLGPLVCGVILLLVGLVLLGFPRALPKSQERRKLAIADGIIKERQRVSGKMKDILPVTKSLLTNGTFMFQNLALTFRFGLLFIIL